MIVQDEHWMRQALQLAARAQAQNEVPVGSIIVLNDEVIGQGWNQPINLQDPTAHAEIMAMRAAAKHINNYRLLNATLYVTLEPCIMCCGAMIHARIQRVVFGALDPKTGCAISVMNIFDAPHHNHRIQYHGGILANDCGTILTQFFKARR
jgi:tRNA(adenine34) deaminase